MAKESALFERLIPNKLIIQAKQAELKIGIAAQQKQIQQEQEYAAQAEAEQQAVMQGGGNGYNPSAGGLPPAQVNPNQTREQVTGQDMAGNELAEGGFV